MRLTLISCVFCLITSFSGRAQQQQPGDTVIVPLGESSKILFTIRDRKDIDVLRHYNFQQLFMDIFDRLENNDSTRLAEHKSEERVMSDHDRNENAENRDTTEANDNEEYTEYSNDDDDIAKWTKSRRGRIGQTWQSYNIDLGTNNYLMDDQFPTGGELFSVRPWGSWYIAGNSVQRTKLGQNFFVEWGLGVSWYNFKFQEDNTLLQKDELGVHFVADSREVDFIKSKLSATFINVSLVPVVDFGEHSRKPRIWNNHGGGFRFGIGPYVGYRIASKTKLVYKEDGDRVKDKDRDNFYLNNLRYGFRIQIGVRSTDLFINYDMNDLFAKDKGPELNAVSFGLIF